VARFLPILLVLGLLGGTAAAFAITEGLKLEKSPIAGTRITKLFSPTCDCPPKDVAHVTFRLRRGSMMTVTVITPDGEPVATIANHYFRRGQVDPPLSWNGLTTAGAPVPDGLYKLRIHLRHQTITLPNTIEVDSTPPAITIKRVVPRVFSPDHDGRREYVTISFGVSSTARPLLYVDGRQVGRGRLARSAGSIHWYGGVHGETYPAGVYQLSLRAEDRAGNISPPTSDVRVAIRYLSLGRKVVHVRAGKRFALRVTSDAESVQWLLRGRSGEGPPGTLRMRAPKKPGRYKLFVTSNGRSQAALVVVSK
jgi:hypothetical protein